MVTGDSVAYVGGTRGIELPRRDDAGVRRPHQPAKPKTTGLDWDAITPTCNGCDQKSGQLAEGGLCPTCRGVKPTKPKKTRRTAFGAVELPEDELLRRFTGNDDTQLGRDLAELEAEDPTVTAAAARLDDAVARAILPEDHVRPENLRTGIHLVDEAPAQSEPADSSPAPGGVAPPVEPPAPSATSAADEGERPRAASAGEVAPKPDVDEDHTPPYLRRLQQVQQAQRVSKPDPAPKPADNITHLPPRYSPEANLNAQLEHAARVLRDTADSNDHVVRLLRLNVLSAIEALHLYTQLYQTTAPAPLPAKSPAGAGPHSTEPVITGPGGDRPAARTEGEAAARPATKKKRHSRFDTHRDEIVRRYLAGESCSSIGADFDADQGSINSYLRREEIPIRSRSDAARLRHTHPTGDTP